MDADERQRIAARVRRACLDAALEAYEDAGLEDRYAGKTAVVTGAASGIGRAIAEHALGLGCNLALADVEADALEAVARGLRDRGGDVLAVRADVSVPDDVIALARRTVARFGDVSFLFNNAGVGVVGPRVWERTSEDWRWVLGVNLWGVVHGIQAFLPIMMEQESGPAHIVNTASAAGLLSPPGMAPYVVSKHGVVALSEVLHHELVEVGAPVRVSVFCPGLVNTQIVDAERNRPPGLENPPDVAGARRARYANLDAQMRSATQGGSPPEEMALAIFAGLEAGDFYIIPHGWIREGVGVRLDDILTGRSPTNPSA